MEEVTPLIGFLDGLKDVVIILAAVASIAALVLLAMLILQILGLVKQIKAETKPLIEETQKTVATVRGTSTFIGSELVKPLITAVSVVSGVQRGLQVLTDLRALSTRTARRPQLREGVRVVEKREIAVHEAERSA